MGRSALVRWAALGVGLVLCPLLSGCLVPVGAAWPSVAVTPVLQANASGDQVRAFRVDTATSHGYIDLSCENEYVLSEAPLSSGGWVYPQGKVACDYFWYWNMIALSYTNLRHHGVMLRLYRPGCQTVEVHSWDLPHEVKWTGVRDLAGQEKAIDELLSTRGANFWQAKHEHDLRLPTDEQAPEAWFQFLAPGSKAPEHRKALLFAVSEYERLSKAAADDAASKPIRERMEQKAAWLRERAAN